MSRQEATNTFTEGMIMDLNPLTTPDSVLTDCLNGTIITYDGNEFILQNDSGNFKLKNARLNPNFIPVGVKEYADILYIVSYNPLTKETEIGSYPSPQRIFTTKDRDNVVTFIPIVPNGSTVNDTYENLTKDIRLQIYTNSSDNDNYMLNPGDEFRLQVENNLNFKYQEIQFAILSEDRELYEIEMPDEYINQLAFKKVFWDIPGWLTGKYRLANLDQFYLNIRNLALPEFIPEDTFNITLNLNSQIEVSDELLINSTTVNTDLRIQLEIYVLANGVETYRETIYSDVLSQYDYNDVSRTYFYNFQNLELTDRTINDTIYVSAVPILVSTGSTIIYEQFRTDLQINLNSISDANDIDAMNTLYKWYVNPDNIALSFNITGPFVNNSLIETHYEIRNLSNVIVSSGQWYDINLFGQNTRNIEFGTTQDPNFLKEDIYLFTLRFVQGGEELRCINNILITSETFNDNYATVNDFSLLYAEDWITNYIKSWKYTNTGGDVTNIDMNQPITDNNLTPSPAFPTSYEVATNVTLQNPTYTISKNIPITLDINSNIEGLTGNLWQNVNSITELIKDDEVIQQLINGDNVVNITFVSSGTATAVMTNQTQTVQTRVKKSLSGYISPTYPFVSYTTMRHGGSGGNDFRISSMQIFNENGTQVSNYDVRDIESLHKSGRYGRFKDQCIQPRDYFVNRGWFFGIMRINMSDNNNSNRATALQIFSAKSDRYNSSTGPTQHYIVCQNVQPNGEMGTTGITILYENGGNNSLESVQAKLRDLIDNVYFISSTSSGPRRLYLINSNNAVTATTQTSYSLNNFSILTTLNNNPKYIANSLNIDMYSSSISQFTTRLRSIESGLTQVNVKQFATNNFTYNSFVNFENKIEYELSINEIIYYNVFDSYDLTDINTEITRQREISIKQNSDALIVKSAGKFYTDVDNSSYQDAITAFFNRFTVRYNSNGITSLQISNSSGSKPWETSTDAAGYVTALTWKSAANLNEYCYLMNYTPVTIPTSP